MTVVPDPALTDWVPLWGGSAQASMVPIFDEVLTANKDNIDILNIPQIYAHLRLVITARTTEAASVTPIGVRFNNDSSTSYLFQQVRGSGATADAFVGGGSSYCKAGNAPSASATANWFAAMTVDIPNYKANIPKPTTATWARLSDGANLDAGTVGSIWNNGAAISRITVLPVGAGGTQLAAGSRVTLYGLGVESPPSPGAVLPTGYGTSLPASPVDGQEYVLVDSVTNPSYQWRFRYNAQNASAYKWECVGGTEWIGATETEDTTTSGTYTNLANGPSFTIPRTGLYNVRPAAIAKHTILGQAIYFAVTGSACDVFIHASAATFYQAIGGRSARLNFNAAQVCQIMVACGGGGTATYSKRSLSIIPVRVS